ncbi:MAG: A24 family peptidase [Planctomycetota bacterium]|nr:A24 family peptidase [Planctomycetota bacterium]
MAWPDGSPGRVPLIDAPIGLLIVFAILGACIGTQVNRAIFNWCWYLRRPYSPWVSPIEGVDARQRRDFIPVLGWWFLRRNAAVHGSGFWIRPLFIELICAATLPLLWWWSTTGGPFPRSFVEAETAFSAKITSWLTWMFVMYAAMVYFMLIATMIDFDEKTIPDQVTIPGALFPLLIAFLGFSFALPIESWSERGVVSFGQTEGTMVDPAQQADDAGVVALNYASPMGGRYQDPEYWVNTPSGLLAGWICILGWVWGLLPKTLTLRKGLFTGFDLLVASIFRPKRQRRGKIKLPPRKMSRLTRWLLGLTPVLLAAVWMSWQAKGASWVQLSSCLMGLALGGGLVWAIRIVASYALGQEAMGFGDVTLMAMIGAYLGWQPALLVFAFAPFAAVIIALAEFALRRRHEIAFGPYLCLSAVIVVLFWDPLWNLWAAPRIFVLGDLLLQVVVVGVILMGVLLLGWGWVKHRLGWM